jgi:hypothetical protein
MSRGLFVGTQHLPPFDRWPLFSLLYLHSYSSSLRRRRSLSILTRRGVHRVPLDHYIDDDEKHHHSALKFDQVRIYQSFALTRTSSSQQSRRVKSDSCCCTRQHPKRQDKLYYRFLCHCFFFSSTLNATLLPQ